MSKPTFTSVISGTGFVRAHSERGKRGKGKHTLDYNAIAQRVATDIAHNPKLSVRAAASQYLDVGHDDFDAHVRGVRHALKAIAQP